MMSWKVLLCLFLFSCLVEEFLCDSGSVSDVNNDSLGSHNLPDNLDTPLLLKHISEGKLAAAYDLIAMGENPNVAELPSGWTPLIYASSSGDVELAKNLLLAGADVNLGCSDGWTALMFASVYGNIHLMELLLEYEANLHQVSNDGATALGCAKLGGVPAAVLFLEEALKSAKLYEIFWDQNGVEAVILSAAYAADDVLLSKLLRDGHDPNTISSGGWSPLMLAASAGSISCMDILVNAGAVVDIQDTDGWSPLMFCAHGGYVEGVKFLVKSSADVLLANNEGYTALLLAHTEGHKAVFDALVDGSFCTELSKGQVPRIMQMIEQGVNSNTACESLAGYTPLIVAVKSQDEAAVEDLVIFRGADVNAVEHDNWSPLMFAALRSSESITKLLLKHGADREILTKQGYSVLRLAQMYNSENQVILGMLENGLEFTDSPSVYAEASKSSIAAETPPSVNVIKKFNADDSSPQKSWFAKLTTFNKKPAAEDEIKHYHASDKTAEGRRSLFSGLFGW